MGDVTVLGAALEVRFADGVWYRGRLVERVTGTEPPTWRVQFDDGELRDDIRLANSPHDAPVRFDDGACGATVEVRCADGAWRRGRLVELVRGGEQWGVAFEDGDWAEDVRLGGPDVRFVFAEGGAGRGEKRGREGGAGDGGSEQSRYVCETCGICCPTPSKLAVHMRTHSGEKPHVCETCGEAFSHAWHLARHMEKTHASVPEGEGKRVRTETGAGDRSGGGGRAEGGRATYSLGFECETCGKAFNQSRSLDSHMRTHSGERPHVCETCGKTCSTSSNLANHMATHSGDEGEGLRLLMLLAKPRVKPHVCETCGKAFSNPRHLGFHMRTHSGKSPHVCQTCGKAFARTGDLTVHMRTHSGERPYVCQTCGKAFARTGDLSVHMRTHTEERQLGAHVCETCSKAFSASRHLARHMRTHTEERTHVCEMCGEAFLRSSHLVGHMRTHTSAKQ